MKKIICIAVLVAAVFATSSCQKAKYISFSPSSVSLSVGDYKNVDAEIKGMDTGVYDIQYTYPSDIVYCTATFGKIKVTGRATGTGKIEAYLKDYPDVKGTLNVTVK